MNNILKLRHNLHRIAELSGREERTSQFIYEYLKDLHPDELFFLANTSVIAVFHGIKKGQALLFRADIDALPIPESIKLPYASLKEGVSHKCGHDGHTAILLGFADYCSENRPNKGKVILLFQHAEETGEGAFGVIHDPLFQSAKPDICFAMHNLPGFVLNSVVVKDGIFTSASMGMIIELNGITSHASEPEKGNNPGKVLAELIIKVSDFTNNDIYSSSFSLVTVVHAQLGSPAFGSSPGEAVLMLTLRAYNSKELNSLSEKIRDMVADLSQTANIGFSIRFTDLFPSTFNDKDAVNLIRKIANKAKLELCELQVPYKWSEDFAHFSSISKSVLFGIGAGKDHPPLHSVDYDFPDEIIETGINLWRDLYKELLI